MSRKNVRNMTDLDKIVSEMKDLNMRLDVDLARAEYERLCKLEQAPKSPTYRPKDFVLQVGGGAESLAIKGFAKTQTEGLVQPTREELLADSGKVVPKNLGRPLYGEIFEVSAATKEEIAANPLRVTKNHRTVARGKRVTLEVQIEGYMKPILIDGCFDLDNTKPEGTITDIQVSDTKQIIDWINKVNKTKTGEPTMQQNIHSNRRTVTISLFDDTPEIPVENALVFSERKVVEDSNEDIIRETIMNSNIKEKLEKHNSVRTEILGEGKKAKLKDLRWEIR